MVYLETYATVTTDLTQLVSVIARCWLPAAQAPGFDDHPLALVPGVPTALAFPPVVESPVALVTVVLLDGEPVAVVVRTVDMTVSPSAPVSPPAPMTVELSPGAAVVPEGVRVSEALEPLVADGSAGVVEEWAEPEDAALGSEIDSGALAVDTGEAEESSGFIRKGTGVPLSAAVSDDAAVASTLPVPNSAEEEGSSVSVAGKLSDASEPVTAGDADEE